MAVNRIANYLVRVVFRFLPGEQGSCAGVGCSRQVTRRAGQTFPYDDRQFGSGTGRAQPIVRYALVVACVLQCQLVDEQDSRALSLHSSEWLDGLAVLQPVQHWRRLPRAVTHKPGCVSPWKRYCLWWLENNWWCCWKGNKTIWLWSIKVKGDSIFV